jgi:hypothetical protein
MTRSKRGAALVEFALILPILLMLFLGIIEFGVLMMHQLTLVQVAREGSRAASLGGPVAQIQARILNMAGALPDADQMTVDMRYSVDNGQTWSSTALGDNAGGENDAPPGSLIRVSLDWPHHMITGAFLTRWLSSAQGDVLPLHSNVIMRRE